MLDPRECGLKSVAEAQHAPVVAICAKLEAEMSEMSDEDRQMFLEELGQAEPGLNRLARSAFKLLGLHRDLFCEANPIPVKWAVQQMGLMPTGIRLPLTPLSEANQGRVLAAMRLAGVIA